MNSYSFRQVHDKANRRVRGLWLRNGSYYVQCTITDPLTDLKRVTKIRLKDAETLEQAKTAASTVREQAAKGQGSFGPLGPTFKAYREHYKAVTHKCSVPRFYRELLPSGFVVNREAAPRSCMVVLSSWAVEVFPNWGADLLGV